MLWFKRKFCLVIVCTANRTRSAYFAEYLRHNLHQYQIDALKRLKILSAGTDAIPGGRANDVVALIAHNNGFSLRRHGAQRVTPNLVRRADLILTMEQVHKDAILKKFPYADGKVFRLMEYGWHDDGEMEENLDVPDPTGKNAEDFKEFIATAHAEAERLMHELAHMISI